MRTLDRQRGDDSFEELLRDGLRRIASTFDPPEPGDFEPDVVRLLLIDEPRPPRRGGLLLMLAAAVVLVVGGLVIAASRIAETAPADRPPAARPTAEPSSSRFVFETPTVRLEADRVEVITPVGTFVPTAEVVVDGDPGTPSEYTTLELTWFEDDVEQRIHIYFASDGVTWWASEIRTYDGASPGDWIEPIITGRYFETPLGEAYTGEVGLPNLRIVGMTLQAFLPIDVCAAPLEPLALVADAPMITGWPGTGYGASFQMYDTATCQPLPIADYDVDFSVDDTNIADIVEVGFPATTLPPSDASVVGVPDTAGPDSGGSQDRAAETRARVEVVFVGLGRTTLRVTATDSDGSVVGRRDVPIVVTEPPENVTAGAAFESPVIGGSTLIEEPSSLVPSTTTLP